MDMQRFTEIFDLEHIYTLPLRSNMATAASPSTAKPLAIPADIAKYTTHMPSILEMKAFKDGFMFMTAVSIVGMCMTWFLHDRVLEDLRTRARAAPQV